MDGPRESASAANDRRPGVTQAWLALLIVFAILVAVGALVGLPLLDDPLTDAPEGIDATLYEAAQAARTPALDRVMELVSFLSGYIMVIAVAVTGALVWGVRAGRWGRVAVLVAGLAGAMIGSQIVKYLVDRPRPPAAGMQSIDGAAFPSGHTWQAVALYGVVLVVILGFEARGTTRALLISVAALAAFAVGVSRVFLGAHWPTDVLGGWLLGALWVAAVGLTVARKLLLP
jgi:undecaprenyl-diphosphatase